MSVLLVNVFEFEFTNLYETYEKIKLWAKMSTN